MSNPRPPRKLLPGQQVSAREYNRGVDQIARATRLSASGILSVQQGPCGTQFSIDTSGFPFLARLTGYYVNAEGLILYSFVEQGVNPSTGIPYDRPGRQTLVVAGIPTDTYAVEDGNLAVTVPAPQPPTSPTATLAAGGTLTVGQPYYYVITAIGGFGETLGSAEVTATPTSGHQTIDLAWVTGPAVNGFNIYRGIVSGGENVLVGTVNSATTTFSDTGISGTPGTPPLVAGTTGPFVEMRFRSMIGGAAVYEFQAPQEGFTGTLGEGSPNPSPPASPVAINNWNYTYSNDTINYTSSPIAYSSSPTTYDSSSTITYNGTPLTFSSNATWTIDPGVAWTILGGSPTTSSLVLSNIPLNLQDVVLNNLNQIIWKVDGLKPLQFQQGANNGGIKVPDLPVFVVVAGNKGDLPFIDAGGVMRRLTGSIALKPGVMTSTGTGSSANNPAWTPIDDSSLQFTTSQGGIVPPSGGGSSNYLRADGTWAAPSPGSTANGSGGAGNATLNCQKFTISYTQVNLSSGTFNLSLATLPTNSYLQNIFLDIATNFTGTGISSSHPVNLSIWTTSVLSPITNPFDLTDNPTGNYSLLSSGQFPLAGLTANFNCTGTSPSLSAGSITLWVYYKTLN